jgi:hypothetical protein
MSKVAIKGAATGTGVFTLESPATNTNRTLVLPDEAGTVLTTAGVPASAMPAGSVIQVVHGFSTTVVSGTSSATIISVSITPSSASNKILVISSAALDTVASSNAYSDLRIHRNGTQIMYQYAGNSGSGGGNVNSPYGLSIVDSPSSTSAVTYSLVGGKASGGTVSWTTAGSGYSLVLLEIAA